MGVLNYIIIMLSYIFCLLLHFDNDGVILNYSLKYQFPHVVYTLFCKLTKREKLNAIIRWVNK